MKPRSLRSLRLELKRSFAAYILALNSSGIADPTEAFVASHEYLAALHRMLGADGFMNRLDDETTTLAGEVHQDLRQRLRGTAMDFDYPELEDRLRECFEYALNQIDGSLTQPL